MKEFSYRIEDPNGLHARPAGQLATYAKRFLSDIKVRANGKEVDGKRLLALMSLGATHGTELSFSVVGEDEEAAVLALEVYCRSMNADAKNGAEKKDGSPHAES